MKLIVSKVTVPTLPKFDEVYRIMASRRGHRVTASSDGIRKTRKSEHPLNNDMIVAREIWQMDAFAFASDKPLDMTVVYSTKDGGYVGDLKFGQYLATMGIAPELLPGCSVCAIGFIEHEQKWAGWSHRAMARFGIGDRIFEEQYGDGDTLFTEHGPETITTLEQARQAAINFAHYVG